MKVDTTDLRVIRLLGAWRDFPPLSEEVLAEESQAFQKAFAREVIQPSVAAHSGEMVLFYYKFLHQVPSDEHSFAFGSKMMPEYVYWVIAARITSDLFVSLVETEGNLTIRREGAKISTDLPLKFLVPVEWRVYLKPRYSNTSHTPHFVVDDSANEKRPGSVVDTEGGRLDISAFGRHLFRFGRMRTDLSWATEIFLVFGNHAVKAWLAEVGSPPDVFEKLKQWQVADTQALPSE